MITIGGDAFEETGYYNEKSNWENDVLYLGKHLLATDESLAGDYSIKPGIITVSDQTFVNCKELKSVLIPKAVSFIGGGALDDCPNLERIIIDSENPCYDSSDNCNAIIITNDMYYEDETDLHYKAGTLLKGCKNTTIPDSVKSIDSEARNRCEKVKFLYSKNSYAYKFAKEHDIPVELNSNIGKDVNCTFYNE